MIYLVSNSYEKNFVGKIKHLEVCKLKFNQFSLNLGHFDALILTSKNAVEALKFNQIKPQNIEVFVIGKATFKACKDYGFTRIYTSQNPYGNEFANEILPLLGGKKTLLIRPKEVVSKISEILEKIDLKVLIGYENLCLNLGPNLRPASGSVLIFTSPKNFECFVRNFGWDSSYRPIAIGRVTASAMSEYATPLIPSNPSIDECIKLGLSII